MKNVQDYIASFEKNDHLGSLFDHKIISLNEFECLSEYVVSPRHNNPNGVLHGGALYTVMDSAQGAFVHYRLDRQQFKFAATGTATIKYLAPVMGGRIKIKTWCERQENRKIFVNSEASNELGQVVATLNEIWIAILK